MWVETVSGLVGGRITSAPVTQIGSSASCFRSYVAISSVVGSGPPAACHSRNAAPKSSLRS